MYNRSKMININKYLDLINKIQKDIANYSIHENSIEDSNIGELISCINNIEEFSVAIFVMRNNFRKMIYDNDGNISYYSLMYRTFNYAYFEVFNRINEGIRGEVEIEEEEIIKQLLLSSRLSVYKKNNESLGFENYPAEDVREYFKRVETISTMNEDMHSYAITQKDLCVYLSDQQISETDMISKATSMIEKQCYISLKDVWIGNEWANLLAANLSTQSDDTIIVDTTTFMSLNKKIISFINKFEAHRCKNPLNQESEMIFAYKTNSYVYISKFCMHVTQEIIEKFIRWGQYDNLISYYFEVQRDEVLLKNYNRLMTYKISDLLFKSQYIIPLEKKMVNSQKIQVPVIEIKNYTCKTKSRVLGDIDVLFYSPHTNTIYIVEYKNYQMYVTGAQKIESEIAKISRERTIEKLLNRKRYIESYKGQFASEFINLFKVGIKVDDANVKAILLTTKPNFYFYINQAKEYLYFDWIEFKKNIEGHIL